MSKISVAAKKVGDFIKKNAFYLLILLCIASVATIIALAASGDFGGETDPGAEVVLPDPDDGGNEEKPDEPDKPDQPDQPEKPVLSFVSPVSGTVSQSYSDSALVWNSTLGQYEVHLGVDFTGEDLSVLASEAGTVSDIITARGGKNIWFLEDGEYVQNPALVAYCAAQNDDEAIRVLQGTYSRVTVVADTAGAFSAPVYENVSDAGAAGGLYVMSTGSAGFGGYELYDASDITHHGVQLYFRYTGGYYPASSERLADDSVTKYSFDFTEGYVPYTGSGTAYVTLPAVTEGDGDGARTVYYYTLIDSGYEEGYVVYSMRECEPIFLRSADGEYAKVNGEYVLYDADVHGADAERYDRVIGYIGNDAANDGGTGLSPLSDTEVNVIEEKSPVILVSLLARQITIGSMSDAIDTLTVEELMEIEPGSVFDSEELRTATVDEISARITALFTAMTVGQLLEYANVSVSAEIAYILSDVHITDFFGALTFNPDTAAIEVDMYKLFGVGA